MKCKICGKRANSLAAMNKHYKKAHPGHTRKTRAERRSRMTTGQRVDATERDYEQLVREGRMPAGIRYCPTCGRKYEGPIG